MPSGFNKIDTDGSSDWQTRKGILTEAEFETEGAKVLSGDSHELADRDACCCGVRWATFFGSQFQMDWVGRVIALS